MTSCKLSPYGLYDTASQCNSEKQCGYKWRCADAGPDQGTAVFTHDGVYDTEEACKCWECNVDTATEVASCRATDGVQGTYKDAATCDTSGACDYGYTCVDEGDKVWERGGVLEKGHVCQYVADGKGGRRLTRADETGGVGWGDLKTYSCSANSLAPSYTPDGGVGNRASSGDLCHYTCKAGEKVLADVLNGTDPRLLHCYDCVDGDTPIPVDGMNGRVDVGDPCTYTCENGAKTYKEGGTIFAETYCFDCRGQNVYTPISGPDGGYTGLEGGCQYWCDEEGEVAAVPRDDRAHANDISKSFASEVKCVTCSGRCDGGYSGALCEMRMPQTGDRWEVRRDNGAAVTSAYDDPENTSVLTFDVSINKDGTISMKSRETRTAIRKDDNGVLVYTPSTTPYLDMTLQRTDESTVLFATGHLANQSRNPTMYAKRTGNTTFAGTSEISLPDNFWIVLRGFNIEMTRVKTEEVEHGISGECKLVKRGVGLYSSISECDASPIDKCGWGYGCSTTDGGTDGECVITSSAPRGQAKFECEMDSTVRCGWGYGCDADAMYACVDGTACTTVPKDTCTTDGGPHTCFNSLVGCVKSSSCRRGVCEGSVLSGWWHISRTNASGTPISLYNYNNDPAAAFQFEVTGGDDEDMYTWYTSDRLHLYGDAGRPVVQIGILDERTPTERTVSVKARGYAHVQPTGGSDVTQWYTKVGDSGRYADPHPVVVARWGTNDPEYSQCHAFDQIDISRMCGGDKTCTHGNVQDLDNVVLQRAEICGLNGINAAHGEITAPPASGNTVMATGPGTEPEATPPHAGAILERSCYCNGGAWVGDKECE